MDNLVEKISIHLSTVSTGQESWWADRCLHNSEIFEFEQFWISNFFIVELIDYKL